MAKLLGVLFVLTSFCMIGCQSGDAGAETPEAEAENQAQAPDMAE